VYGRIAYGTWYSVWTISVWHFCMNCLHAYTLIHLYSCTHTFTQHDGIWYIDPSTGETVVVVEYSMA
jgi:hypothetical protein